ncbi:branched-chain amino acid ABC transporter permease [Nibricoccus sp. IMCC34717]|uniref:branched-chain amino acid ABC transporter permease n=1 Tax=Nibricoccus sp. IMCC34717 TaxID=3034021 RepID=UPI003850122A
MPRPFLVLLLSIGVAAGLSPLLSGISPYFLDILISIGINLILAASLNLINGYTGQFSLGHAGFMAVGAYTASWVTLAFAPAASPSPLVFAGALAAGALGAALAGLVVGVPALRLTGDYLAIVTLGFNEIIKGAIQNAEPLGAQRGLAGMVQYTGFGVTYACVAFTLVSIFLIRHSTLGLGFPATRDNEIAARVLGLNTTRYKVGAFAVAAAFAGLAGGLYAHFKQFVHPEAFNFMRSMDIVVMVILGGTGHMVGVCCAAVLLTLLPEALRFVAHLPWLPGWLQQVAANRMIFYAIALIVLMLVRPQGLFARKAQSQGGTP